MSSQAADVAVDSFHIAAAHHLGVLKHGRLIALVGSELFDALCERTTFLQRIGNLPVQPGRPSVWVKPRSTRNIVLVELGEERPLEFSFEIRPNSSRD